MQANIVPLFSIPVLYIYDTGRLLENFELDIINSLEEEQNLNQVSKNTKVLDIPELKNLKNFCQTNIDMYAKEVCGVVDDFYITNSWTTKNKNNVEHHKHNHPNSIFSGVYYFQAEEDCSPFLLHGKSPIFKDFNLEYHYENYNMFNSNSWSFPVKSGTMIVFPSWVNHSSPPNTSQNERRLIGFNSFVRGSFGDFNYCSDLELK
jgi:uncharacterized protein (TIGR02466 family)